MEIVGVCQGGIAQGTGPPREMGPQRATPLPHPQHCDLRLYTFDEVSIILFIHFLFSFCGFLFLKFLSNHLTYDYNYCSNVYSSVKRVDAIKSYFFKLVKLCR